MYRIMMFTDAEWRGRLGANRSCQSNVELQTCSEFSGKCRNKCRFAARRKATFGKKIEGSQ